jgi:hypothetical protein
VPALLGGIHPNQPHPLQQNVNIFYSTDFINIDYLSHSVSRSWDFPRGELSAGKVSFTMVLILNKTDAHKKSLHSSKE